MDHNSGAQPFRAAPIGLAALFALLMVWFGGTRFNDFPVDYHPDEPTKVEQIQENTYNFHHPLLLLRATRLFITEGDDRQEIAEAGRRASALFAAGAAGCAVLIAGMLGGVRPAWGTAFLLAANNQLFELAHYFKEDPALAFGIGAGLAAAMLYWRNFSPFTAILLGCTGALAVSGKYVGVSLVPFLALLPALRPPLPRQRIIHFTLFLLACGGLWLAINAPILQARDTFEGSFERELDYVVKGHKGMTRSVPHDAYTASFSKNLTPVLWVGLLAFYARLWQRRKELGWAVWLCGLWPLFYAVMLSFSPKTNDRYFLPATLIFTTLAAVGLWWLAEKPWKMRFPPVARYVAFIGLALLVQSPRTVAYWNAFRHDDRAELGRWMVVNLPHGSAYVQDSRAGLPPPGLEFPFVDRSKSRFAADAGPVEDLRSQGIRFVVASEGDYGRFFSDSLKPAKGSETQFKTRKAFYEQLEREGVLMKELPRSKVIYLHPGLKLFDLSPQDVGKLPPDTVPHPTQNPGKMEPGMNAAKFP